MINSYEPQMCPYCGLDSFIKVVFDPNGIRRYRCKCGKTFKPTTGTIFDSRKISVSEWIEYCLNIFWYVSLNADSWNNRNAISTSKYWLEKLFLTLENTQNNIVLEGTVWLDETYYSIIMRDRERDENGNLLRGLSRNQICIGVATDKKHAVCIMVSPHKNAAINLLRIILSRVLHWFTTRRIHTENLLGNYLLIAFVIHPKM